MLLGQRGAELPLHNAPAAAVAPAPGAAGTTAAPARAGIVRRVEAGWHSGLDPVDRPTDAAFSDTLPFRRPSGGLSLAQEKDRRVAREVQQGFLPRAMPQLAGLSIAGRSWTADDVGGDCFDFIPSRSNGRECLDVLLGDASGHGVAAALMMAETRAYARALALTCRDPGELATLTNRRLAEHLAPGRFVTLLLVQLDPAARSLLYTSAGHLPAYVLDRHGRVRTTLSSVGIPVGIDGTRAYCTGPAVQLEPGDLVFLYTDGVVEAASPDGQDFGLSRMLQLLRSQRHRSPDEILDALFHAVGEFTEGHLHDDVTAVAIQVAPPAGV